MNPNSDELLERLLALHPKVIDLSLDRMERILNALGNPEQSLPAVIHIAGTNGKGSTGAMIRAGLEAEGKAVHAYTSPHLARFHERIRLRGDLISESQLAALLEEVETANQGQPITFFEVTTAAAFLAFSRIPADYLILEVGLGGRLDATNVMTPKLSVITPISLDHESYLGETLTQIAGEKAGIIKAQTPVLIGKQMGESEAVLEKRAHELNAPVLWQDQDFQSYTQNGHLIYQDEGGLWDLPMPSLLGPHQIDNAGLALAALRALHAREPAMEAALTNADWPARMQRLKSGPILEATGAELWLDGGHNPAAGLMLAETLKSLPPKPLVLIIGMLNTKDIAGYLAPLAKLDPEVFTVSIEGEAATLSAEETAAMARKLGLQATPKSSPLEAAKAIEASEGKRVLICGSLYLAGRILREHE